MVIQARRRGKRTRSESSGRKLGSSGSVELEGLSVLIDERVGHGVEVEASGEGHLMTRRRNRSVRVKKTRDDQGRRRTAVTSSGEARKFTEKKRRRKVSSEFEKIVAKREHSRDSLVLRFPSFRALKFLRRRKDEGGGSARVRRRETGIRRRTG